MLVADIYRLKDSYYAMAAELQSGDEETKKKREELQKESRAWVEKYAKLGKWKAHYPFSNGRGGISIWEFESGEEMARILSESIIFGHIESETIPLSEVDMIANILKESA